MVLTPFLSLGNKGSGASTLPCKYDGPVIQLGLGNQDLDPFLADLRELSDSGNLLGSYRLHINDKVELDFLSYACNILLA